MITAAPMRVLPVRSSSTVAICEPLVGSRNTPTTAGHMAARVAGERPRAMPMGMMEKVALDWLVVMAATANRATAIMRGFCLASSPRPPTITSWLAAMKVLAIQATPNRATTATMPESNRGLLTMSPALMRHSAVIRAATVNMVIWISCERSTSTSLSLAITRGRSSSKMPAHTMKITPARKIRAERLPSAVTGLAWPSLLGGWSWPEARRAWYSGSSSSSLPRRFITKAATMMARMEAGTVMDRMSVILKPSGAIRPTMAAVAAETGLEVMASCPAVAARARGRSGRTLLA